MSDKSPSLEVLEQILATLKRIEARLPPPPPRTATDGELDGPYGDPVVRFQPRAIPEATEEVKGKRLSELSIAALEALVEAYDGFAQKNDAAGAVDKKGGPKSKWDRENAALCRGWIARKTRAKSGVRRAAPRQAAESGPQPPAGAGDAWEPPDTPAATGTDDGDDYE